MIKEVEITELKVLNNTIRDVYDVNFEDYAFNFYRRAIIKAANELNVPSMELLISQVKQDKTFFEKFCNNLVVKTTEFFRDPSFWLTLKHVLRDYCQDKDQINIWVAGCASGEEVVSLAILLKEAGLYSKSKIHATETNCLNLNQLKELTYSLKGLELANSNYERFEGINGFSDYYTIKDENILFDKSLLDHVNTKCGYLFNYNPEIKYDLILCRNVMIYFNQKLQERVYTNFSESLLSDGLLAIGINETLAGFSNSKKYTVLSPDESIYIRF